MQVVVQPLLPPAMLPPPEAISVQVEPLAESDWEVVEMNAGHLEDTMLQQVGVQYCVFIVTFELTNDGQDRC